MTDDDVAERRARMFAIDGGRMPRHRPELRRTPPAEPACLRLRVDLDHAEPPIWRRLEVRSDVGLDVLHQVLQASFEWYDTHLHRFSLGGGPFDLDSQVFLCPFDVEEGDEDGVPAAGVTLGEVMGDEGDVLRYVYDYGDSWEHTLVLEAVLPADPETPRATCTDGERSAPPEDSGGITTAEDLAAVLGDPAYFSVAEVDEALRSPYLRLHQVGLPSRLLALVAGLGFDLDGVDLAARAVAVADVPELTDEEVRQALRPVRWLLDRAAGDGLQLTSSGHLRPADVVAISPLVPTVAGWIGAGNRESDMRPLLGFREAVTRTGLLRKRKGRLLLTRAGARLTEDPRGLWRHLAEHLVPPPEKRFQHEATLLLLLLVATAGDREPDLRARVAAAMSDLGWSSGREPLHSGHVTDLDARVLLDNLTGQPATSATRDRVHAPSRNLAAAALLGGA